MKKDVMSIVEITASVSCMICWLSVLYDVLFNGACICVYSVTDAIILVTFGIVGTIAPLKVWSTLSEMKERRLVKTLTSVEIEEMEA